MVPRDRSRLIKFSALNLIGSCNVIGVTRQARGFRTPRLNGFSVQTSVSSTRLSAFCAEPKFRANKSEARYSLARRLCHLAFQATRQEIMGLERRGSFYWSRRQIAMKKWVARG